MTSPFQTELRARAAAHAREWQAAADPSVGLAEVEATVRRRRRTRGVLAGAGALACAAIVVGVAFAGLGRAPDAAPGATSAGPTPPSLGPATSALAPLTDVADDAAVLVVADPDVVTPGLRVLIVGEDGLESDVVMSSALVADALGDAVVGWPNVTLLAIVPAQDLVIFQVDPIAYATPRVALHNTADGTTTVVDPCEGSVDGVDLIQFCVTGPHSAWVVDPATGEGGGLYGFAECDVADQRLEGDIVARCSRGTGAMQVVAINPYSGEATAVPGFDGWILGSPFVVNGQVYANFNTTEGDPILSGANYASVDVDGGSVGGIARAGDSIVVYTGSDAFGAQPPYGQVLGVWNPSSGDFAAIDPPGVGVDDVTPVLIVRTGS